MWIKKNVAKIEKEKLKQNVLFHEDNSVSFLVMIFQPMEQYGK
jgi:hypothetical protein